MKLSKLISELQGLQKASGTYDPEVTILGKKIDTGIDFMSMSFNFAHIHVKNEKYVPCKECGANSQRLCNCDQ